MPAVFAQIIPVKRGPLHLPFFDYIVPDQLAKNIQVGHLVIIPVRKSLIFGVVFSLNLTSSLSEKSLKSIDSIIFEVPLFNIHELNFLKELSELYHTSLGFLVKLFLPPLTKTKLKKIALTKKVNPTPLPTKPQLHIYQNTAARTNFLQKFDKLDGQTLIIVPEISRATETATLFAGSGVAIVTSQTSPKELFKLWFQIQQGEIKIIVGTRRALFLSYNNLTTIIIDDEGNDNHKSWDMAPRFHTRDAAIILAKHSGAKLFLASNIPSVESYFFAKNKVYNLIGEVAPPNNIQLLSILSDHRAGNFNSLTLEAQDKIQNAHGQIFLHCHRLGSYHIVLCRDCAYSPTCNTCGKHSTYFAARGQLVCPYCRTASLLPLTCPKCQNSSFSFLGIGTEGLAVEIKKLFPEKTITRIEANTLPTTSPKTDIIIGTSQAWNYLPWNNLEHIIFTDADTPLFIPEFKAGENVWQEINTSAFRLGLNGTVYIQTTRPEHPLFANLTNPQNWYAEELRQRKIVSYPPYNYLLKLLVGRKTTESAYAESNLVLDKINRLTRKADGITIVGPINSFPAFKNGQYWNILIVKIPYEHYKQSIRTILECVPNDWKVDPNPNTLISL